MELSWERKNMLVYLASPYSHESANIRSQRYQLALQTARKILDTGVAVFSPIVASHPLVVSADATEKHKFAFWKRLDLGVIDIVDELWVLDIDGRNESGGVKAEINYAHTQGKPVRLVGVDGVPGEPIVRKLYHKFFHIFWANGARDAAHIQSVDPIIGMPQEILDRYPDTVTVFDEDGTLEMEWSKAC